MLKALSLKQMIFAGFGVVLALLIVLGGMSLRGTTRLVTTLPTTAKRRAKACW
jgi:CHASE3 domain sensor protein